MRGFHGLRIALIATLSAVSGAFAQDAAKYPEQLVRIVVPFSAGSMSDLLARVIADKLSQRWNQQVIVENRPGVAGTASVAKAAADGYTLLITANGHTVVGLINKNLAFDPLKDFVAVTQVASTPLVMIVPPESPARSVKDLIGMAKAAPGKLNYASAGPGSTTGLAGSLFRKITQIDIVPVHFKGLPETHTAVIRGDVAWGFTFPSGGGDLIQSGKIRALAVTAAKRLAALPNVPTFPEAGVPEFEHEPWFGILAPAGVPKEIVAKASQAIAGVLELPDVKARFEPQGTLLVGNAPDRFDAIIKADAGRFATLFGAAN